jgi:hypothetical protein
MAAQTNQALGERPIPGAPVDHDSNSPHITLFAAFGLGKSYIFYVEKGKESRAAENDNYDPALECWKEIFKGRKGDWSYKRLKNYNKPLGETVTLTLWDENSNKAETPIKEFREACEKEFSAKLKKIEAVFFTTGVAVLSVRLIPKEPGDVLKYTYKDDEQLPNVNEGIGKIIESCKAQYVKVMSDARRRRSGKCCKDSKWFLRKFEEVDRDGWEPKMWVPYPLFCVDQDTYERRIREILKQVAGSEWQRERQSDKAIVSYNRAEVYVDWSEALVCDVGKNRESIENNFIIALASWYALVLMNKNSSVFLFEAYIETVTDRPQSNAKAVSHRNMAYKDVADSSLPIRWTTSRKDLFLLETIHRNWSSDRWRKNIEERMKLLALHYESLEDDNNARASRKLALVAISLAVITLASAFADLSTLWGKPQKVSFWVSAIVPSIVWAILFWFFWYKPRRRARGKNNKQPKIEPSAAEVTENTQ